jgi:5-methylcytosine-specific restriction endonuclease McrBC regulatory subunit McrC
MSTRSPRRPKSQRDIEGALSTHIQVEEKDTYTIEEYPKDIAEQLKRAAFQKDTASTYVKRVNTANTSGGAKVVTVEIGSDELVIETEDVVGIVNLTPNATLQIDPKIGWSEILEMFLAVSEQRRSLEYQGIPIREFLADDIGIEDVFVVVALNYLESLEDIFRHGFIRSFDRKRTKGLQGRGRIDIERSLKNFDLPNGVPKHEFVEKTVEYSIPINDVIYNAGEELRRLFHLYASDSPTDGYTRIFSRLEQALSRLRQRGVTGESVKLSDVPSITPEGIPRQRDYYIDALQISKTILSSTIGQPLDEGREQLLMEYIIGMDSLFESYAALVIEEEVNHLSRSPLSNGLEGVNVEKESYRLFETEDLTQRIQPDHVLSVDGSPVAVLDSKYYAESKSPLDGSWARSRLLSYGFRLDTDCLGMITPLAKQGRYEFKGRPGAMHVIAPKEDSFTTDGFRRAVRGFLKSELGESDELEIRDMLTTHSICHPDVTVHSWEDCLSISELQAEKLVTEVRQILKFATTDARLSDEANPRGTPYLGPLRDFRTYIENDIMAFDIAVPFYISSTDPRAEEILSMDDVPEEEGLNEFIEFHCFNTDDEGVVTSYEVPTPFGMAW